MIWLKISGFVEVDGPTLSTMWEKEEEMQETSSSHGNDLVNRMKKK